MTDKPGWRRTYDTAERAVAPRAEALVRTREFAVATTAVAGIRRAVGSRLSALTSAGWHLVNLPARSDVQRLRVQIGALDRDVRRLSLQLEEAKTIRGRGDQ
jgi:hypothetical protein